MARGQRQERRRQRWLAFRGQTRSLLLAGIGLLAARGVAHAQHPSRESLPAEPPVEGILWTVIVPVLLFGVAVFATLALYRYFSGERSASSRDGRAT